jgi:ornithine carbamoyltransferase
MPALSDRPGHLITGEELDAAALEALLVRADELKVGREDGLGGEALAGRTVALFFEMPSTRTRVSFQVGVSELGGHPLPLRADELQLGRGESIADTARVLSRYLHAIVIRSAAHETVVELASTAGVPVINALTPLHHPVQALADLQTMRERFGQLDGVKVAYVGDGNNMARSLALVGRTAGVEVRVATPPGYELEPGLAALDTHDGAEAAADADVLYTDVWFSMGDTEAAAKREVLAPYQLNEKLLEVASDRAIFMHCLPAHPGEEISEAALYGERSAVWDQAENRLHAQKALLELLVGVRPRG